MTPPSATYSTTDRKVCLISGASTGIGAACAVEFCRQGWNVAVSYFGNQGRGEAQAFIDQTLGAGVTRVLPVPLDVTDDESCRAAAAMVLASWGRIDALVNCAGTTRFIPHADLESLDAAELQRVYEVNLIGAFQLTRACATALSASGAGSVVNVSSIAGLRGSGSSLAYASSKGALNTMTLSLARSLAPAVRVNAIAPGFVDGGLPSRMLAPEQHDEILQRQLAAAALRRVSQPSEIAALARFLCDHAPGMTGQIIVANNGLQL